MARVERFSGSQEARVSYLGVNPQVAARRRLPGSARVISPLSQTGAEYPSQTGEIVFRARANNATARAFFAAAGEHLFLALQACAALTLLVFILPLMIILAFAICAQDGGPPIFKHCRVGLNGRPFHCWKFRTMCVDADVRLAELLAADPEARREWQADQKLRRDPRITRLGRFLRKSSLDELPQLINILRGEMNLVGPRPIVEAEIPRYGWRYKHYTAVKPGVTGLWQISGRNEVDYRTRVALDTLYSKKRNVLFDIWIVVCTVPVVLCSRGSY
jgi:exopolysaccharide production protein ExoY